MSHDTIIKTADDLKVVVVRLSTNLGQIERGWGKYELFAPDGYTFSGGETSLIVDSMAEARRTVADEFLVDVNNFI